jgi:hypothetical protein
MARLFIDGFESGSLDLWDTINGGAASTVQKKGGAYSYLTSAINQTLIKNLDSGVATIYFKVWLYINSVGLSNPTLFLIFADNAGNQIGLGLDASRQLIFRLNPNTLNGGTTIATGATVLALTTWYLIEGKIFIDDVNGIAQCKLNGVLPLEIDYSGDTRSQGTTITKVFLGTYGSATAYTIYGYFDDFVLDDASWIGDTRIQAISPTGVGTTTGWTPSAGNNWDCVEEIPASDVDYIYINANDILDTYATGNLIGGVSEVKCVQVQGRTVYQGAPTPTNLKLAIRSNGVDYVSANKSVPASYKSLFNIWETDPDTSATWLVAAVNAAEIGVKSAA